MKIVRRFLSGASAPLARYCIMVIAAEADGDPNQPFQYVSDFVGMPLLAIVGGAQVLASNRENEQRTRQMPRKVALATGLLIMLAKLILDTKISGARSLDHLNAYEVSTYPTMVPVAYSLLRRAPVTLGSEGLAKKVAVLGFGGFLVTFAIDMAR